MKKLLIFSLLFPSLVLGEDPVPGNRFVYALLRHEGTWDPYPALWPEIASTLERTTSLRPWPERRAVGENDPSLYESPFVLLTGRGPVRLTEDALESLRRYLSAGGFLFIDSAEADRAGPFARSLEALPEKLFPGQRWADIPPDHALFRAFFLLPSGNGPGRRQSARPRGLWVQGRLAAVFSVNDAHGVWARAPGGGWLFPCDPGGDLQREESRRFLMNAVIFSVTGTYKTDAIHQEFIKDKLE
jgi:hypothetical protein